VTYDPKTENAIEIAVSVPSQGPESGNGAGVLESKDAHDSTPLLDVIVHIWHERWFIAKAASVGLLLTTALAFCLPKTYESTTRLMPPDKQSATTLAMLAESVDQSVTDLATDALGLKTPGALIIGMLRSRTVADRLIAENSLLRVYGTHLMLNARQMLANNTQISEDRKSGIITLTVTDRSPQRAAALARGYAEEVNQVMGELDSSAAHRERVFIEERLKSVKQDLDSASRELGEFSSKNTAVDLPTQGKAMVESAAAVQGELIAAQAQLSGLEQIYTDKHFRVRALRARIAELEKQLANIRGSDASTAKDSSGSGETGGYPSIRKLPLLGLTYYDLYRRAKIQETVYEILTKQFELAKIEEAKELPSIRVLDDADIPERKSSPKRLQMMILGTFLSAFFATGCVLVFYRWNAMVTQHPVKLVGSEIRRGLVEDLDLMRAALRVQRLRPRLPSTASKANDSSDN
jgi:uncharacterized protein involved in exopolysaccharide biosynthesis